MADTSELAATPPQAGGPPTAAGAPPGSPSASTPPASPAIRWRTRCASRPTWAFRAVELLAFEGAAHSQGELCGVWFNDLDTAGGTACSACWSRSPALAARAVHRRAAAHVQQAHPRVRDGAGTGDDRPGGVHRRGRDRDARQPAQHAPLGAVLAGAAGRLSPPGGLRAGARRRGHTGRRDGLPGGCAHLRPAGTGDRAPGGRRHDRRRARAGVRPERALGDARGRGRAERPPRVPAHGARGAGGALPHPRRPPGGLPRPPCARELGRQRGHRLSAPGGAGRPIGLRRTVDSGTGGARPRSGAACGRATTLAPCPLDRRSERESPRAPGSLQQPARPVRGQVRFRLSRSVPLARRSLVPARTCYQGRAPRYPLYCDGPATGTVTARRLHPVWQGHRWG